MSTDANTLRIYLHVAIPSSKENMMLPLAWRKKIKRKLRSMIDWLAWFAADTFLFKSYNYTSRAYCNRGDIAIKLTIKQLLRKELREYDVEFVETEWGELDEVKLAEINKQASLFVIAGGGYWVFDRAERLSPSFLSDLPYFKKMNCPIAVFACGVNFNIPSADVKLEGGVSAELSAAFAEFEKSVDLLAVRDQLSFDFLRSLNLRKQQLLGDPAVFLQAEAVQQRKVSSRPAIGINLAFHGVFAETLIKQNLPVYIAALREINRRFQPHFYYFVHSDQELLIVDLLRHAGIELEVVDKPVPELVGAYAKLDVLLCQMMHSNVLAFNAGVPAVNIAYGSKNFGFNRLIGMEPYCVSAYRASESLLADKVAELLENRERFAEDLAAKKIAMEAQMQAFLGQVRHLAVASVDTAAA